MAGVNGEGSNDLDMILEALSRKLIQLDTLSREIIRVIAKEGPANPSAINRRVGTSYPTTVRNSLGLGNRPGLLGADFVLDSGFRMFTETNELKQTHYALSFKGFLASLASLRLQFNYLINDYTDSLNFLTSDQKLVLKDYMKVEIALWLQTCKENGLDLTNVRDMERFYHLTKDSEKVFGSRYELPEAQKNENLTSDKENLDMDMLTDYIRGYSDDWRRLVRLKACLNQKLEDFPEEVKIHLDLWYHFMMENKVPTPKASWLER